MPPLERDPNRIYSFCNHLINAWQAAPYMRFGQFVENLQYEVRQQGLDPFYLEDDQMRRVIDELAAKFTHSAPAE